MSILYILHWLHNIVKWPVQVLSRPPGCDGRVCTVQAADTLLEHLPVVGRNGRARGFEAHVDQLRRAIQHNDNGVANVAVKVVQSRPVCVCVGVC